MKSILSAGALGFLTSFLLLLAAISLVSGDSITNPELYFPATEDSMIALSILEWVKACLLGGDICGDFPIFYPYSGALYLTEHMFGIALFYTFVTSFGADIHAAYGITFLIFTLLNFAVTWVFLFKVLELGYIAAFFGAAGFALQPLTMWYLPHIHLAPFFFFPAILIAIEYFRRGRMPSLITISILVATQFWFGMTLGMFGFMVAAFSFVAVVILDSTLRKKIVSRRLDFLKFAILASAIFAIILLPLHSLYTAEIESGIIARELSAAVPFSYELSGFLYFILGDSTYKEIFKNGVPINFTEYRHLGYMVAAGLLVAFTQKSAKLSPGLAAARYWLGVSFSGMIFFVLLSLGPYFIHRGEATDYVLPYALFYYVLPGFESMRVPVRFVILVYFMASILGAILLSTALEKINSRRLLGLSSILLKRKLIYRNLALTFSLAVLLGAWMADRDQPAWPSIPIADLRASVPAVYSKMPKVNSGPVLDFPMWPPSKSAKYMYFQIFDRMPRIGGVSSNFPPEFFGLVNATASCPSKFCFQAVDDTVAAWFVVHLSSMTTEERELWHDYKKPFGSFIFFEEADDVLVWARI